jgi:membrane protein DedA with SNARE-associated domain
MAARLFELVIEYGVALVFLNVFLEQIGVPIPAVPTLIIAGALSRSGQMSSTNTIIAAVAGSLVADYIWFLLGRRYGYSVLKTLCRISLSPDSCVRETESRFERFGLKALLFAKFIPGFSTVAPPLAGASRRSTASFLLYDGLGSLIWAGAAVAVGRAFHTAIGRALERLEALGSWAIAIVVAILVLFVLIKWAQRQQFYRQLRMARISVHELKELIDRGSDPVVFDVRTTAARARDPRRIPAAIAMTADDIDRHTTSFTPEVVIILYCT